jgi:hypothetical protein
MKMNYAMFSDEALVKFRGFCDAAGFRKPPSPAGAFDAMPKAVTRKEPNMKFRYTRVPHCGGSLFLRERSSNLAFDEATEITDKAKEILDFLRDKISDEDLHQVEESLKMEAGVKTDQQEEADKMIAGAEARRAGAQDAKRRQLALDASAAASTARMDDFAARFPGTQRLGHV